MQYRVQCTPSHFRHCLLELSGRSSCSAPFGSKFTGFLHLLICPFISLCFYWTQLDSAYLIDIIISPLDTFYYTQQTCNVLSNFNKNISHFDPMPFCVWLDFFPCCKRTQIPQLNWIRTLCQLKHILINILYICPPPPSWPSLS